MNKYFQYIYINVLIFNFAFCQLAKQYYVNEKINTLDRTLSNKIYDLSKSFDLKLSEMENNKNNISHISKLYPNGKPKEVFLYKAENIFKHNPYKIQAKVQYNIDGNIKIIDKFYDNGGRMLTATYSEKMPNGKWIKWYENGQIAIETNYKKGERDGAEIEWYENGKKKRETKYEKGMKYGLDLEWYENGQKKLINEQDNDINDELDYGTSVNDDKNLLEIDNKYSVIIQTTYGDMVIKFFKNAAPKHIENFKSHVTNKYYDGTIFHRVIPGFMIQGGDPNTKGDNKSSYGIGGHAAKYFGIGSLDEKKTWKVPAEFNTIKHKKGIVSMARSNNPNSAGSQFFICAADVSHLNGKYTVFGKVVEGLDIIDKIIDIPRDARDNPNSRVEIKIILK